MEIMDIVLIALVVAVILVFLICLAIANFAGENLLTIYEKYSKYPAGYNDTLSFADIVSDMEFNGKVKSSVIDGFLTDNYYKGVISLSKPVAYANNISAFAVCAHELGHAMQYRDNPAKMKSFTRKLVFSKIASKLTIPLFVIGVICIFFNLIVALTVISFSILCFIIGLLAKLSTIKVEKEASENALILLQKYADFDESMIKEAKKVLKAAKLTYVAAFLKSVLAWTFLVRKYDFY